MRGRDVWLKKTASGRQAGSQFTEDTYQNARVDNPKANCLLHAEIGVHNTMRGAVPGHEGGAGWVEHSTSVAARIRLDLSIRLGPSKSAEWSDHVVLPCWRCGEPKRCLYPFADGKDIEVRVEERGVDVRWVEGVCRSKGDRPACSVPHLEALLLSSNMTYER